LARGRPLQKLELSASERDQLQALARGSKTSQALALRSRIVLSCAHALTNNEVARLFGVAPQTVGKWRTRFIAKRLDGLIDEPRSGPPRKMGDAEIARLVTTVLETPERADGRPWSSRALAAQARVSQSTVSRVLRGMGLQPQAAETFRLTIDPRYIDKVRDIIGLYVDAPLRAVALCIDDKRHAPPGGHPERWPSVSPQLPPRRSLSHPLHGDKPLFEALDQVSCRLGGEAAARACGSRALLEFLRALDTAVPAERAVHVVVDDKGRRKRPTVDKWIACKPHFRLHVAPSCAAWVAQVERWFALLAQREARSEGARTTDELERAVRAYLDDAQPARKRLVWVKQQLDLMEPR
jgi:transposase